MKFVDYVTISVRSGKGGAGAVSFRREKYAPRGGPDGGDGGEGGSVMLQGDRQLYTLLDLRYNRHHFAENGKRGAGSNKKGKDGDSIILRVPIGTLAKDSDSGEIIAEVLEEGPPIPLVIGGRGGKGNDFFKTATRRTPRFAQPGEPGEERDIALELKLMADVGLVGFPNVGKSTLVASLSAARPKIADYPFTTLAPSLGVVSAGDYQSFVIADIPGIIEGAHEGKGLGIRFLKHIERNAMLLLMIPSTTEDVRAEYETLLAELEAFNPRMLEKPRAVAISKMDLISPDERESFQADVRRDLGDTETIFAISAVAHTGLDELRMELWRRIEKARSFDAG